MGALQQVLRHSKNLDPETARWFEVIDRFDSALAANATVETLVRLAADLTGRPAGIRDEWSGLQVGADRGALVEANSLSSDEVTCEVFTTRLRGRNAARVALRGGSALAVSVEVGAGRVGVAWTLGAKRTRWRPLDYLVTERLATAVGAAALAKRNRQAIGNGHELAAVEKLVGGNLPDQELARIARIAKLPLDTALVAIAIEQSPPNTVSQEALGAIAERTLRNRGVIAKAGVIGRITGLIATKGTVTAAALASVHQATTGFEIRIGVGDAAELAGLPLSWEHAKESLALGNLVGDGRTVLFDELGVLHLLAQIPTSEIVGSKLFNLLNDSLAHRGTPSDVDVLAAYLDEGTLRGAAAKVFLHHTTVEHRLKRIEDQLGLDLSQPPARFQAQLLLKLQRIVQLRDASQI